MQEVLAAGSISVFARPEEHTTLTATDHITFLAVPLQGAPQPAVLRPAMFAESFRQPVESLQFNRGVHSMGCCKCIRQLSSQKRPLSSTLNHHVTAGNVAVGGGLQLSNSCGSRSARIWGVQDHHLQTSCMCPPCPIYAVSATPSYCSAPTGEVVYLPQLENNPLGRGLLYVMGAYSQKQQLRNGACVLYQSITEASESTELQQGR
jgi:hypothetical protein